MEDRRGKSHQYGLEFVVAKPINNEGVKLLITLDFLLRPIVVPEQRIVLTLVVPPLGTQMTNENKKNHHVLTSVMLSMN